MENKLSQKKCIPCESGTPPLTRAQFAPFLENIPDWKVIDDRQIEKIFKFTDFADALAFVNNVGAIAEKNGHHPDINLFGWNKVKITLSTHAIDGLSENDFILASKIDEI